MSKTDMCKKTARKKEAIYVLYFYFFYIMICASNNKKRGKSFTFLHNILAIVLYQIERGLIISSESL